MPNCFSNDYKSPHFMQNAIIEELLEKTDDSKRVLVVVDALKELPVNLLEFILRRFTTRDRCTVRLLGVKPYLNIPLSSKAWSDIWSLKIDDLSNLHELQNDPKYQKVQRLVELCYNYGVVPEIKSETGYSLRLRIIEQISSYACLTGPFGTTMSGPVWICLNLPDPSFNGFGAIPIYYL